VAIRADALRFVADPSVWVVTAGLSLAPLILFEFCKTRRK
jgi:hypothetical protein